MSKKNVFARFFSEPNSAKQNQYEFLRAHFLDGKTIIKAGEKFGYTSGASYSLINQFKVDMEQNNRPEYFLKPTTGPKADRKKKDIRHHVIRLRACDYASTDIRRALRASGYAVSLSLVEQILQEEELGTMARRTAELREKIRLEIENRKVPGLDTSFAKAPLRPEKANVEVLGFQHPRNMPCQSAGVFMFLPFLNAVGFDQLIGQAQWPGTKMIPACSYGLTSLLLKLLARERKSHIDEWSCDSAMGLFAGLNVPPKKQATTDYSYRLSSRHLENFMGGWAKAAYPYLCPDGANEFALDAHTIAYRGRDDLLQTHYVPTQGKKKPAIISFFARTINLPFLCYALADLRKDELSGLPLRFADYWNNLVGKQPEWLYFDSRTTTYEELGKLNERNIYFITVRRKGNKMLEKLACAKGWKSTTIATAQYPHAKIKYLDQLIELTGYKGPVRQITQQRPNKTMSLFLTNNLKDPARQILARYHQRNYIENEIGVNVNFFHMDCLCSEVALNVSLDVLMTLVANGCYRWLSKKMKGCEKLEPKKLYRMLVNTPGTISMDDSCIRVCFERRSHNPIMRQALEQDEPSKIPWMNNLPLIFSFK